ncbi:MAG: hypothetical protein HYV28_06395 [Ignavibacteriales bacterium]|nr:hypothetical protein [Ignavibacteriales bacterium]
MLSAQSNPKWIGATVKKLELELIKKYGDAQAGRITIGLKQVSSLWKSTDGDSKAFEGFVHSNFAGEQKTYDAMFERYQYLFEKLDGHLQEIGREFRQQSDLDLGPILPFDELFAAYNPGAHVNDDFFENKLAFVVLLNFPIKSLEEKIAYGAKWSRREWAEIRMAERFSKRIPASVAQEISKAAALSDQYIAEYNIFMHSVINAKGDRLFPKGMRLLSHWNLRDQIKADYSEQKNGIEKQRTILKIMEHIVNQTIPKVVVNNPNFDWNPFTNKVTPAIEIDKDYVTAKKGEDLNKPEPDTRYEVLLKTFQASRLVDPYAPTAPTLIARRFNEDREIPEERVRKMFVDVLTSPLAKQVAELIKKRLGRELEPFDVWYNGFRPRGKYTEEQLDKICREKYPTPEAYKKDMPNLLKKLGFSAERADMLAANIVIDPARGSGHAMGAGMREAKTHLRTRIGTNGMDYKGFNIAVHEMGHNVEQTFSLNMVDNTSLQGVPNTAFTEALAFVFQAHDLELLGLASDNKETEALKTINDFWMTFEIAGVALVDMEVWKFMYANPKVTPQALREQTIAISKEIWNKYYTPVLGMKDVNLLGVYSHMIHSFLYLPDYPLGHLIAFQIDEQIKKSGNLGVEFERVARQGRISPDLWMQNAAGTPVGPDALLRETAKALSIIK